MSGFFGKISSGINKGVATVGANSKAMMEKAKVNTTISNLEGERTQLVQLLGARIYDMHKQTGELAIDEGVTNFILEIAKREEAIEVQKEQLIRIDEEVKMVTGGVKPVAQGGRLCSCGQDNSIESKFCVKCGGQLQEV